MPLIKIDCIISFSSEDPTHKCENILSTDTTKKWKCKTPGEKSAVVVLQLEKASVISGIDIGNEHSAYVEVLVSRSGSNDDYKVLLVTSSFMSPLESRQSQNINKVRMFTRDQLSKPECDEKWDRVKIVCTQPFNKHVHYGLSFIKLHTSDKDENTAIQMSIGKFLIRPDSPDNLSAGSLFSKRKEFKEERLSGAAAIRDAMRESVSPVCKPKLITHDASPSPSLKKRSENSNSTPKPRNRNEILYSRDEEEPNEKIDKLIKKNEESKEKDSEKTKMKHLKTSSVKKKESVYDSANVTPDTKKKNIVKASEGSKRKHKDNSEEKSKKKKKIATKPFSVLLEGVTLVISGIQNPDRANLRSQALAMGAKYKSDWDNTCTHLICAFPNTPKFNQVKGRGKIVKRLWVEDCYNQRKRLPWRLYALDKNDQGDESEEEICEQVVESSSEPETDFSEHREEASDTDERITRILEKKNMIEKIDVYNADTEEEDLNFVTVD